MTFFNDKQKKYFETLWKFEKQSDCPLEKWENNVEKKLLLILLSCSLLLTGCGGHSSTNCSEDNLTITSVQDSEETLHASHKMELEYVVSSETPLTDIDVKFYLLHVEQYDSYLEQGGEPPQQFYFGYDKIDKVNAGTNQRIVELQVPDEITIDGEYYLVAEVDPDNVIEEFDETDNIYASHQETEQTTSMSFTITNPLLNPDTAYSETTNLMPTISLSIMRLSSSMKKIRDDLRSYAALSEQRSHCL